MADAPVNYPDILGLITGGKRVNLGVVQAALAVRPRTTRAGRPFEAVLLLQNASDVDVDVVAVLTLPQTDNARQKGRFLTKSTRLLVGIAPAEVGYVLMPATTLADVALGSDYRIGIEIDVKPLAKGGAKPQRIRASEGGGTVDLPALSDHAREQIEALSLLDWTADKKLTRPMLETSFAVMQGKLGQLPNFKPGWVSIAKLSDFADLRPLLARYGDTLVVDVLPHVKRTDSYRTLLHETSERFQSAGFALEKSEAALIAKLLALILEYAMPEETGHGYLAAGRYAIKPLLATDPMQMAQSPDLPRWAVAMLELLERDSRAAAQPMGAVGKSLYEPLLHDAARLAFELIERETGEDLGTLAEHERHVNDLIDLLHSGRGLDFAHVYLPLVLGGLIINEQMPASTERPSELVRASIDALARRQAELENDDLRPLFALSATLLDRIGQKYGFGV